MAKRYDMSELSFLVVDDNNYMRSIIKTLLKGFGVLNVSEAADAAEAFEAFQNTKFDIVIVDYSLETLDGIEFIQLIRQASDSPNPYVPIVMLTTFSDRNRVEEARDAGVTEFLCKPISAKDLYVRLLQIIERPRPFIRSKAYFGPDRRRRSDSNYTGPERRKDKLAEAANKPVIVDDQQASAS